MNKISRDISHFNLIDWDFKTETSKEFGHDFCWYPSRFIPIIPAYLIQGLSKEGDTVLDPYCGSGTTIIESLKQNRHAIGLDLNPIACFLSKTKAAVFKEHSVDVAIVNSFLEELESFDSSSPSSKQENLFNLGTPLPRVNKNDIPNYTENLHWYHKDTLNMLGYLHNKIISIESSITQDLLKLLFISILIPSSGHDNKKPYTYYADNVKPRNDKKLSDSIILYKNKLKRFLREYSSSTLNGQYGFQIINDDIRNLKDHFEERQFDLIVTSPPYFSVTDYTTAYRLVYLWNFFEVKMDMVKQKEIGARWRRKNRNGVENYLQNLNQSISDMNYVLKDGGYMCLIFGGSKKFGSILKKEIQEHLINNVGLELVEYYSRNLSKNFFLHPKGGVPTEDIVILRK
jgi:site-specific DNA-methyltransferase (cytosine-N4-specific)